MQEFDKMNDRLLDIKTPLSLICAQQAGFRIRIIRIRTDPVFLNGSGSGFQISLDPDPVFKFSGSGPGSGFSQDSGKLQKGL